MQNPFPEYFWPCKSWSRIIKGPNNIFRPKRSWTKLFQDIFWWTNKNPGLVMFAAQIFLKPKSFTSPKNFRAKNLSKCLNQKLLVVHKDFLDQKHFRTKIENCFTKHYLALNVVHGTQFWTQYSQNPRFTQTFILFCNFELFVRLKNFSGPKIFVPIILDLKFVLEYKLYLDQKFALE